jgi:hypothetical protein
MDKKDLKNLKRRYLIWLYKAAKEALDRVERKFTQLDIDRFILAQLHRDPGLAKAGKFIAEFQAYIRNKEKEGAALKFEGRQLKPDYLFLVMKLRAIEKAIIKDLGKDALKEIKSLYEEEMTRRILKNSESR